MRVLEPLIELVRGLWTTLRFMFEKPVTVQYPEQKKPVKARFRGSGNWYTRIAYAMGEAMVELLGKPTNH